MSVAAKGLETIFLKSQCVWRSFQRAYENPTKKAQICRPNLSPLISIFGDQFREHMKIQQKRSKFTRYRSHFHNYQLFTVLQKISTIKRRIENSRENSYRGKTVHNFICKTCKKRFGIMRYLRSQEVAYGTKMFQCQECSKCLNTGFSRHVKTVHSQ